MAKVRQQLFFGANQQLKHLEKCFTGLVIEDVGAYGNGCAEEAWWDDAFSAASKGSPGGSSLLADGGPSLPPACWWEGRLVRGRPGRLATAGRMGVRARRIRH